MNRSACQEEKQDKVIKAIKSYEEFKKHEEQKDSESKILNAIKEEKPQAKKDEVSSIIRQMNKFASILLKNVPNDNISN